MAGMYRLVASDIDGTLLINWDPRGIDPRVFDAIRVLRERGVRFLASSGRQYANLRRLFSPVADCIDYLCENGALAVSGGEVVARHPMERGLALEVCRAITSTPGCDLLASGTWTCYTLEGEPDFAEHMRRVVGNDVTPVARPEDIPEEIIKVSFHADAARMDEVRDGLARRFESRCKVVTSGATWFDVMAPGVDKGATMRELGELWGIAPGEMVAFGDNFNDAEMLDLVGLPFLMDSGSQALREKNPRLEACSSVADALERLLAAPGVL